MRVPKRAGAPQRRRTQLRAPHLCLEVREEAIYWALGRARAAGLEPEAWGSIPRDLSRSIDEQLAALRAQGLGGELSCETALRAAGAVHERTRLPALSRRETQQVVRRRSAAFAERIGEQACAAISRASLPSHTTLWFAGVDSSESEECRKQWLKRGFALDRLQSRHLALGQLARCLPDLGEGEVVAIFDIERETGTCVLADLDGWIFSREVPLRFMGRSVEVRAEPPPGESDTQAFELDGQPSGLELAGAPERALEEQNPLEDIASQAERLATELRRTFRYAEGQLGAAPVTRVILAGEITELIDLRPSLSEHLRLPVEVLSEPSENEADARPVGGAAVVLGMACSPDRQGGNLLHAGVQRERSQRRWRRRLARALIVSTLVLGAGALATVLRLGSLTSRLVEFDSLWSSEEHARARVAAMQTSRERAREIQETLARLDAPAPSVVALLRTLALETPEDAAVKRLRLEPDALGWNVSIHVESHAATTAQVAQSVAQLAKSLESAPFARIERVEREARGAAADDFAAEARTVFELSGRLAPIERSVAAVQNGTSG